MMQPRTYRFFEDDGHGWLEVPLSDVEASGASISHYSSYDPQTHMAYLEEDCDLISFLRAAGKNDTCIGPAVMNSLPRQLPSYGEKEAA